MLSSRTLFFIGFLGCASLLAVAGYFQFLEHLEPCPLCIVQRVAVLFIGLILLLAVLHNPKQWGIKVYALFSGSIALLGAGVSARHVWLQNLPEDQVPSCGPGLSFMIENFPLKDALKMVLNGSGECAEVLWTLFGLSIPAWTLIAFLLLALMTLSQLFTKKTRSDFISSF